MATFNLFAVLALLFISTVTATTAHSSPLEPVHTTEDVFVTTTVIYSTTYIVKTIDTVTSNASGLSTSLFSSVTSSEMPILTSTSTSTFVFVPTTIPVVDSGVMTIQTSTPVSNATSLDSISTSLPASSGSLTPIFQSANSTLHIETSTTASASQTVFPGESTTDTSELRSIGPSTIVITRTLSRTTSSTVSPSATTSAALVNAAETVSKGPVVGMVVAMGVLFFGY
ncbi:hypothetical protein BKA66DRAFT_573916 [Pyrenochaeta sp. MPI-SDFR-AT-0127]|nr:hypothetical protein BKA66DRAFT_573916 [Pyrenochaeta sp. MPI-SDFR-AT-0127]